MQLKENTILVTGGGSGIGRGLAEAFHALGNQVIISGRTQKTLDETVKANPGMKALTVDMTDPRSIAQFVDTVKMQFPELNILLNNAGIMQNEHIPDSGTEIAEKTIATNLLGPLRLTATLLETLRKNKGPVIMNVSSGLAFVPLAMTPSYCATKAAMHSYTQSLRYQLKDAGVEVIEIIPPYVQTSLMGDRQANDPNAMPLSDFLAEVMTLLSSRPTPEEICVERVAPLRDAAEKGRAEYRQFFNHFNAMMKSARHAE